MSTSFLARAVAAVVSSRDGLTAVHLPEGVGSDFAHAVAKEANAIRPTHSNPFAVVVSDPDNFEVDVVEVSAADLVRYRQGDRLAIASGRIPELSSLTTSFSVALSQSFPEPTGASGDADELLKLVARALMDIVIDASGARPAQLSRDDSADLMYSVLDQLRLVHKEFGHGLLSWNRRWFDHVDIGSQQLTRVIASFVESEPSRPLKSILAEALFASFGLPAPTNGRSLAPQRIGASIRDAHDEWWGTSELVVASFRVLERQLGEKHPAASLDWAWLDTERASSDDPVLAWGKVSARSVQHTLALSRLSEAQFFSPAYASAERASLQVFDADWRKLDEFNEPVAIIRLDGGGLSPVLRILLPTALFPDLGRLNASGITIEPSKGFVWAGELRHSNEHGMFMQGQLRSTKSDNLAVLVRFSLGIPHDDPLVGSVLPADAAQVLAMPHADRSVVAIELRSRDRLSNAAISVDLAVDDPILELRSSRAKYRLIVRSKNQGRVSLDGRAIPLFGSHDDMFKVDFTPQESNRLSLGDLEISIAAPRRDSVPKSPILAAVTGDEPSPDSLGEADSASLRGRYEDLVSKPRSDDDDWWRALGHVAVSATDDSDFSSVVEHSGIVMPNSAAKIWQESLDFAVPESVLTSTAARRFRAAFEALDLFGYVSEPELANQLRWPSRYPRRVLWADKREQLNEYLDSYVKLVEHARTLDDDSALFWASYPFSLSIWSLDPADAGCKSVLLSPLHPLRLSWQASVEAALWESSDAELLVGTIQGYGFPSVGPNEHTAAGMLAIQSDSGTDQIFLGWSVMVSASGEKFGPLTMPSRAGGVETPGTAASGLNASSVNAALKTYRRMNPHVSTITIDLASKSPSPRLTEVDNAIVSVLEGWSKGGIESLPGGARVLDSSNRTGSLPLEKATTLVRSHPGLPLSWSRYEHFEGGAKRSNMRILEDAGLRVRVKQDSGVDGNGVVGQIPLRRFDSSPGQIDASGAVRSSPTISGSKGWVQFTEALYAIEGTSTIAAKLQGTLLFDDNADWTVSGESMLSPTALAKLLSNTSARRMLWEWRPPMFSQGRAVLEQKPYLSVARVPSSFQKQLEDMLTKAMGRHAKSEDVDRLLETLGARGVGLSSLLAMGGTQASGALGFYLAFRLLDKTTFPAGSRFVLPIDACDSFLRALARGSIHGDDRRRADLLVVDVSDKGIVLTPLEIKFYGFGAEAPSTVLPTLESAAMGEPLGQLDTTEQLLKAIVDRQSAVGASGNPLEQALWSNALAALLDAASKLDPRERDAMSWHENLGAVVRGERDVLAGAPLVLYFNFQASFPDGAKFETYKSNGPHMQMERFGALIASSETVFEAVDSDASVLVDEWSDLLAWAVEVTERERGTRQKIVPKPAMPTETNSDNGGPGINIRPTDTFPLEPASTAGARDGSVPDYLADSLHQVIPSNPGFTEAPSEGRSAVAGADESTQGVIFPVGVMLDSIAPVAAQFWPGNTALNQLNIGVAGDLGTGKTQLLKSLVYQLRQQAARTQENPLSMLIFDYKRDYQDEKFLNSVGGRLLRPERIPLNVFALSGHFTPLKAVQRARMFVDVIAKIYGGVGPVQKSQLQKAIVESYGRGGVAPTIGDVLNRYVAATPKPDSVSSILDDFVMAQIFSEDPGELRTFEELIEDRVLVVALSDLGVDQSGKNALVVLFLNMYYDYMLRATKWPYSGADQKTRRLNSFLLVDEATNIMEYEFPVLMQLLLQGREFGFGTILASQYLSHFKTSKLNYGEPLLTWFIHKVPNVSGKELQQLGVTTSPLGLDLRIARLPVHDTFYSSYGHPGVFVRGTPFFELVADSASGQ